MLPSSGKRCEFVIAENLKIWNCARKNKQVCARKSREGEIPIEFTLHEGAKIMNKAHLLASSFVLFG